MNSRFGDLLQIDYMKQSPVHFASMFVTLKASVSWDENIGIKLYLKVQNVLILLNVPFLQFETCRESFGHSLQLIYKLTMRRTMKLAAVHMNSLFKLLP